MHVQHISFRQAQGGRHVEKARQKISLVLVECFVLKKSDPMDPRIQQQDPQEKFDFALRVAQEAFAEKVIVCSVRLFLFSPVFWFSVFTLRTS